VEHRRQQVTGITISAGVAVYPEHGPTGHAVLRAADAALYQAKRAGRNRVCAASVLPAPETPAALPRSGASAAR
jgi:diguanylate cyclase (GGDEF)-like protein